MWLPGSKALMPRLRYPSSKGPPPLQSCRICLGTPETDKPLQTMGLPVSTHVAFAPPHQEDIFLTALKILFCAQRVSKRGDYRPKLKSKNLSLWRNLDFVSYQWALEWLLQDAISVPVSPSLFANTLWLWTLFLSTEGQRATQSKNSTPCQILNYVFWDNKNAIIFSKD